MPPGQTDTSHQIISPLRLVGRAALCLIALPRALYCYWKTQKWRKEAIRRDYKAGERVGLLSRRYGLSEQRIQQILRSSPQSS